MGDDKYSTTYGNIFCVMGLRRIIWHGELTDMHRESQTKSIDVEIGDQLKDMIRDLGQESF